MTNPFQDFKDLRETKEKNALQQKAEEQLFYEERLRMWRKGLVKADPYVRMIFRTLEQYQQSVYPDSFVGSATYGCEDFSLPGWQIHHFEYVAGWLQYKDVRVVVEFDEQYSPVQFRVELWNETKDKYGEAKFRLKCGLSEIELIDALRQLPVPF